MGNTRSKRSTAAKACQILPVKTAVGAAVFCAIYGLPYPVLADQADTSSESLQEITVTATRREQTLEAVPVQPLRHQRRPAQSERA